MSWSWTLLRALHLVAMGFFVGGQLMLALVLVPVERRSPDRERLRTAARRFAAGSFAALAVLAVTGAALAGHFEQWGDSLLHAKLALVAGVVALIVWHARRPGLHALEAAILLASLVIIWLGVSLAH